MRHCRKKLDPYTCASIPRLTGRNNNRAGENCVHPVQRLVPKAPGDRIAKEDRNESVRRLCRSKACRSACSHNALCMRVCPPPLALRASITPWSYPTFTAPSSTIVLPIASGSSRLQRRGVLLIILLLTLYIDGDPDRIQFRRRVKRKVQRRIALTSWRNSLTTSKSSFIVIINTTIWSAVGQSVPCANPSSKCAPLCRATSRSFC